MGSSAWALCYFYSKVFADFHNFRLSIYARCSQYLLLFHCTRASSRFPNDVVSDILCITFLHSEHCWCSTFARASSRFFLKKFVRYSQLTTLLPRSTLTVLRGCPMFTRAPSPFSEWSFVRYFTTSFSRMLFLILFVIPRSQGLVLFHDTDSVTIPTIFFSRMAFIFLSPSHVHPPGLCPAFAAKVSSDTHNLFFYCSSVDNAAVVL